MLSLYQNFFFLHLCKKLFHVASPRKAAAKARPPKKTAVMMKVRARVSVKARRVVMTAMTALKAAPTAMMEKSLPS